MPRLRTKPKNRGKELADEKIREIARKHFAEDFPNPERRGCRLISEIKLLADKPLEGKDWVLGHISFCSPCYRDFAHFLRAGRKKVGVKQTERINLKMFGARTLEHRLLRYSNAAWDGQELRTSDALTRYSPTGVRILTPKFPTHSSTHNLFTMRLART